MRSTGTETLATRYYGINLHVSYNSNVPEYWLVETGNGGDEYIGHMPPTPSQVEDFRRRVSNHKWNN